jgi:transcriptional regulator with PAS, ATPase and Fis domain
MSHDPLDGPDIDDAGRGTDLGGLSPRMRQVMELAARVAPLDTTVLITGESGVGKERLARWLHNRSPRARGPFVAVNGAALADSLIDSELFGHARGAFTGAIGDGVGVFEAAHRGTLFLDEIGEVSAATQVKLLRVIQEREVRRVGDARTRPVDVRILAATNRDLVRDVAQGRFRRDLYYRLHVVDLHVPPLRERPEDLRALANAFLMRAAARLGRPVTAFAPDAFEQLQRYPWPGNIRELEHAVERACVVATGTLIGPDDLPPEVAQAMPANSDDRSAGPLRARERDHILAVLARHGGNRRRAAEELRISLSTLKRRLRPNRLPRPE